MAVVLLVSGKTIKAPLCADPFTGESYVYATNVNNVTVRVYVAPGESVDYVEIPTGPANPDGATGFTMAA